MTYRPISPPISVRGALEENESERGYASSKEFSTQGMSKSWGLAMIKPIVSLTPCPRTFTHPAKQAHGEGDGEGGGARSHRGDGRRVLGDGIVLLTGFFLDYHEMIMDDRVAWAE